MNKEFKTLNHNNETIYVLESATGGSSSSAGGSTLSLPLGELQTRIKKLKEKATRQTVSVPASNQAPRKGPPAPQTGAGAHRNKKKEQKQGQQKHKKPFVEQIMDEIEQISELENNQPDHEISMASSELTSIAKDAANLLDIVKQRSEEEGLEAWQQSKITKAADFMNSVLQSISGDEEQGVAEIRSSFQGKLDREKDEFKRNELEFELGHERQPYRPAAPPPKGMYFYNVKPGQERIAQAVGLRQTKSGKWFSKYPNPEAGGKFGPGRYWEPKSEGVAESSEKLKGTPVVSLGDFDDKDTTKNKYGQTVPKKLKKDDQRVKFHKEPKKGVAEGYQEYNKLQDKIERILIKVYSKYGTRDQILNVAKPMAQKVAQQMGMEKYFDEIWSNALAGHDVDTNFGDNDDNFDWTRHSMRKGEQGAMEDRDPEDEQRSRERAQSRAMANQYYAAQTAAQEEKYVNMDVNELENLAAMKKQEISKLLPQINAVQGSNFLPNSPLRKLSNTVSELTKDLEIINRVLKRKNQRGVGEGEYDPAEYDPLSAREKFGKVYRSHYPKDNNPHHAAGRRDPRSTNMYAYDIKRTGPQGRLPGESIEEESAIMSRNGILADLQDYVDSLDELDDNTLAAIYKIITGVDVDVEQDNIEDPREYGERSADLDAQHYGMSEGKIKGVDGKACWKGKRYAGKVKKADGTYKDKCVEDAYINQLMAALESKK